MAIQTAAKVGQQSEPSCFQLQMHVHLPRSLSALPSRVRGAVGVRLSLLCLLVFLPFYFAPLCGWAFVFVSCLFGVCRLPRCLSLLPFPPRLDLCGALAQSLRWSLPLGIWLHL